MIKKFINTVLKKIAQKANHFGNIMNQNPSKEQNLKAKKRISFYQEPEKKKNKIPVEKNQKLNDVYSHIGSGHKGKGSINTDSSVFNRPRKDIPRGRDH